jgi:hypothetical protein
MGSTGCRHKTGLQQQQQRAASSDTCEIDIASIHTTQADVLEVLPCSKALQHCPYNNHNTTELN